ncbi:hypothetical protein C8Q72DRAFT_2570 [Fomitopsis betulina]|nr:hypothetical protein C8Q72DRAFT_2570 [Fomitopsis betulina]
MGYEHAFSHPSVLLTLTSKQSNIGSSTTSSPVPYGSGVAPAAMLTEGDVAVALVQKQVMIVQGASTHTLRDRWLDVHIFSPFGDRLFLASAVTSARILSTDILTIFPSDEAFQLPAECILELHPKALSEFRELQAHMQKKYEQLLQHWFKYQPQPLQRYIYVLLLRHLSGSSY